MRRKGETRISTIERGFPFSAVLQVHYRRPQAERDAGHRAAAAISAGDYRTASTRLDSGIRFIFRSADQAHAMQIWLEAHSTPYDPWEERRESMEASRRRLQECADIVNAAAAVGIPARLCRAKQLGYDTTQALRMLEPRFDTPMANWCIGMLHHYGAL